MQLKQVNDTEDSNHISKFQSFKLSKNSYIISITHTKYSEVYKIYFEPVCYTMHTENYSRVVQKSEIA